MKNLKVWGFGILLFLTFSTFVGCSSKSVAFEESDAKIVEHITKSNPWEFQKQRVNLVAMDKNSIVVDFEGFVKAKTNENLSYSPLVVCVGTVRNLPKFYKSLNEDLRVEIQAYEVGGNRWGIIAIVWLDESLFKPDQVSPLKVKTLLIHPDYDGSIPIAIPTAQSSTIVESSVILPGNSTFKTFNLRTSAVNSDTPNLILQPTALSDGAVKASAMLQNVPQSGWDFSEVTFSERPTNLASPWFIVASSVFLTFLVQVAWVFLRSAYPEHNELEEFYSEFLRNAETNKERERAFLGMKDYFRSVVKNLRTYLFGAILAIVVLLALLLVSTTAKGQSPNAEQNAELVPVNALGSLGIRIVPDSGDQGKAGVLVSFVPLSNSRENKRKGIVGVGTGDSMVRIGEFKAEPNEMVERVQVSEKSAQYQVPVTSYVADVLSVLANPDFRVTGVDGSALGYQESLRSGNSIRFDYFLLDSYTSGDKSQNGWIHFFPFDTKKLEIPIRFQQAAIVHNVEIVKPKDFFGTPTISGIHANFKEEKDGFRLMHASMNSFPTIGKDQDITIGLKMGRSWFQVFWLTLGQILLVIFPAWILGLIAAFPENRFYSLLVECIGVFSFAWLIRTQVFGTYPNMPNVLTGQLPITIYDIFFLLSLAVTIFVSLRVYFRTVKNLRKQDEAEKQNEAEKRRDELLRRNS